MDSGFCVLQGLVELKKVGVFAHVLIKKQQYWPKHVPGQQIIEHFADISIGFSDAIKGELDAVISSFNRKCTKDTFKGSLFGCQENVSTTTLTIV